MAITVLPTIDESGEGYDLPQYGFGAAVDFGSLVRANRFLFRVYTPKEQTPPHGSDSTTPFFVASKYDATYTLLAEEILRGQTPVDPSAAGFHSGTYEGIATHMDWTTRHHSAYISTSFSFAWAIWEALRRYHSGVKQDVQVAIIDASAVSHKAVTGVDMLRSAPESGRRREHWQWYRFAQESQAVLVHQYIPSYAVLASVPILSLLEKLPSYFLRAPPTPGNEKSILSNLGWDYASKKQSFRQFCQAMSNRFLQLSAESKLEAATTGSIRLAITFLRPWLERTACASAVPDNATDVLFSLSLLIAQWPGKWWAEEHAELLNVLQGIVNSFVDEFKKADAREESDNDITPVSPIDTWFEKHPSQSPVDAANSRWIPPLVIPPSFHGLKPIHTVASPSPLVLARSPAVPAEASNSTETNMPRPTTPVRSTSRVTTPITPPQSPPRRPRLPSNASISSVGSSTMTPLPSPTTTVAGSSQEKLPYFEDTTLCEGISDIHDVFTGPSTTVKVPPSTKVEELSEEEEGMYTEKAEAITRIPYPIPSPTDTAAKPLERPSLVVDVDSIAVNGEKAQAAGPSLSTTPVQRKNGDVSLSSLWDSVPSPRRWRERREPTMLEKAGCIITGFVVGAWFTMSIMGPGVRPLLVRT